jgi:1,4-dihydroxy-2-naphthoyl-CoA synthase
MCDEAQQAVETVADNAPLMLRVLKPAIAAARHPKTPAAHLATMACFRGEDCQEGHQAFAEKPRPIFQRR